MSERRSARRGGRDAPAAREGGARRTSSDLLETKVVWRAFYRVVRRIPAGRVCTYGGVAAMAGHPRAARHVGQALAALKETCANHDVPWHRVLGSRPRRRAAISIPDPVGGAIQRAMLEAEGVRFDTRGHIELDEFGWFRTPRAAAPPASSRGARSGRSG